MINLWRKFAFMPPPADEDRSPNAPERPSKGRVLLVVLGSLVAAAALQKLASDFGDYLDHQGQLADRADGRLAQTRQEVQLARQALRHVRAQGRAAAPAPVDELDPDEG